MWFSDQFGLKRNIHFALLAWKGYVYLNVLAEEGRRPKRSTFKFFKSLVVLLRQFFYTSPYISGWSRLKPYGSFWLVVIVGAKEVDHSYLDGFSRRCLLKLDKKGPTLSQKRPTLSGGNIGLLAPKLMHFFQKTGIWKIFLFNCLIFHERFFVLTKRSWNVLL